jgi:hypothetical protein
MWLWFSVHCISITKYSLLQDVIHEIVDLEVKVVAVHALVITCIICRYSFARDFILVAVDDLIRLSYPIVPRSGSGVCSSVISDRLGTRTGGIWVDRK